MCLCTVCFNEVSKFIFNTSEDIYEERKKKQVKNKEKQRKGKEQQMFFKRKNTALQLVQKVERVC